MAEMQTSGETELFPESLHERAASLIADFSMLSHSEVSRRLLDMGIQPVELFGSLSNCMSITTAQITDLLALVCTGKTKMPDGKREAASQLQWRIGTLGKLDLVCAVAALDIPPPSPHSKVPDYKAKYGLITSVSRSAHELDESRRRNSKYVLGILRLLAERKAATPKQAKSLLYSSDSLTKRMNAPSDKPTTVHHLQRTRRGVEKIMQPRFTKFISAPPPRPKSPAAQPPDESAHEPFPPDEAYLTDPPAKEFGDEPHLDEEGSNNDAPF